MRAVFIIGPDKKLKLSMTYPMTVGRNLGEILRALDGLQLTAREEVATPANWEVGQDVIVRTSLNDEAAEKRYGTLQQEAPVPAHGEDAGLTKRSNERPCWRPAGRARCRGSPLLHPAGPAPAASETPCAASARRGSGAFSLRTCQPG